MHDIAMKFVGAASDKYRGDVVGCWVCVRSSKVLRIKDDYCLSAGEICGNHEWNHRKSIQEWHHRQSFPTLEVLPDRGIILPTWFIKARGQRKPGNAIS
eukprot:6639844-Karenia_brevis.AAC.1